MKTDVLLVAQAYHSLICNDADVFKTFCYGAEYAVRVTAFLSVKHIILDH